MVSQIRPFGSDITSGQGLFSDPLTDTLVTGSIASYPTAASSPGNDLNITATSGEAGFNGGVVRIVAGQNGFGSSGAGGYVDISGGEGLGTVSGDVYIHAGLGYGGGTTGTVFLGYTPNESSHPGTVVTVGDQADPALTTFNVYANTNAERVSATQAQLGADDATNGLILVQPGGTQIGGLTGPPITLGPVYYDPANGMTIRFGASIFIDGDGVVNTINGRDATMPINEVYYDVPAPPALSYDLTVVGSGILNQFPVVPGTVTVQVILDGGVVFSTVTDNGAGAFPASAALPGGGTINYTTGAITGNTDVLKPYSQIVFFYVVADQSGEDLSPRGGHGEGTGAGGDLTLAGGDGGTTSGNAGSIFIVGGTPTDGNGGGITLTATAGVGTNRDGGDVTISAGVATGSGAGGIVALSSGVSPSGTDGAITFTTGTTTATEAARFDSGGTLYIGDNTAGSWATGPLTPYTILSYRTGTVNFNGQYAFSATTTDQSSLNFVRGRGTAASPSAVTNGDSLGQVIFSGFVTGTTGGNAASITAFADGTVSTGPILPGRLVLSTTPAAGGSPIERVRVDNAGTVFIGDGTAAAAITGASAEWSMTAYRNSNSNIANYAFSATASDRATLNLVRARGTAASPAIVQSGDTLGEIQFFGFDGAASARVGASITAAVDGTPGTGDMPGRLMFGTTADGSGAVTERLRIANDGLFTFTGNLRPDADATRTLGVANVGWQALYLAEGIDTTAGDSATINRPCGRFRKDTSGTTFTLTNSLITANSIILLTLASTLADWPTSICSYAVAAGAGSAVITFNAAPTGDADFNFLIINTD